MPSLPYIYQITIYELDGETGAKDVSITAVNNRTNNALTETTDSDGVVLFDFSNFIDYENNDIVFISAGGFKLEGQDAVDMIARKMIKNLKTEWRDELKNTLWNPSLIQSNPLPFDNERGIFRRMIEVKFNGVNLGEG